VRSPVGWPPAPALAGERGPSLQRFYIDLPLLFAWWATVPAMSATFTPRLIEDPEQREPTSRPDIEIVVPVYNEERVLAQSIYRLHRFLGHRLPFAWRIVIADNASSDLTPEIGRRLADRLPNVTYLRLDQKGRGRALRAAWSRSQARVVAYMDVDLSTDLRALLPLVAPLLSGHSQLAVGSRLCRGARVTRGRKREFISRSYNRLLRLVLRARFSDAQCGFKAVRRDVVAELLPAIRDEAWFFDTELLVNAQRAGLRIHEVPVDWIEDPDSRVDILSAAVADLRGMARLAAAARPARFLLATRRGPIAPAPRSPPAPQAGPPSRRPAGRSPAGR
jgi:hypothetical protein